MNEYPEWMAKLPCETRKEAMALYDKLVAVQQQHDNLWYSICAECRNE